MLQKGIFFYFDTYKNPKVFDYEPNMYGYSFPRGDVAGEVLPG